MAHLKFACLPLSHRLVAALAASMVFGLAPGAFAQDEPAADDAELDALADEDADQTELADAGQPTDSEADPAAGAAPPDLPEADDKKEKHTQLLMGMRYRAIIVPKWLINVFGVDGGRTEVVNGVGPEVGAFWGKDGNGFTVMGSVWRAWYGMEDTPFKGPNDPNSAWEVINSNMKVWYLTVDAVWEHEIVHTFGFNVGLGVGIGFVNGQLQRNEAYIDNFSPQYPAEKDWPNLSLCPGIGSPNAIECPADGNYNIVQGTSSPHWPVYPWLNFQMGLRYQPVDEFVAHFDVGLGSSGFWLGLGADYSLWL